MTIDEDAMRFLEEQIPELANSAFKQAYWQTLAAGYNVIESENKTIIEVHPDGTKRIIKQVSPAIPPDCHILMGRIRFLFL